MYSYSHIHLYMNIYIIWHSNDYCNDWWCERRWRITPWVGKVWVNSFYTCCLHQWCPGTKKPMHCVIKHITCHAIHCCDPPRLTKHCGGAVAPPYLAPVWFSTNLDKLLEKCSLFSSFFGELFPTNCNTKLGLFILSHLSFNSRGYWKLYKSAISLYQS